jgi:hypothetical protein
VPAGSVIATSGLLRIIKNSGTLLTTYCGHYTLIVDANYLIYLSFFKKNAGQTHAIHSN